MSRERTGKIIGNNQNAQTRNYGALGGAHAGTGSKEPLKLGNVYSNVQQKRQAARQMLNKKSSEEKLHSQHSGQIMYNKRQPVEQRYKSHLRGQDVPQGMVRNQSKPALQLPEIHNTSIGKQNEVLSRNDVQSQILNSNRSKKSLSHVHGQ